MKTRKIVVRGLVQGIGFRPFVAELAEQLNITGWVRNTDGIVTICATAEEEVLDEFAVCLKEKAPTGSLVEQISVTEMEAEQYFGFSIVESTSGREDMQPQKEQSREYPLLPADLATCKRCNRELHDRKNRRFRHPFISCTSCGPRYSILEDIPYDREHITMRAFSMCPDCKKEYTLQGDIRRHAQTIACRDCGPRLQFLDSKTKERGAWKTDDKTCLDNAIRHLQQGGILAVKDIGGFHFAASPFEEETVCKLRRIKGREAKPFAVMFPDAKSVREYCRMSQEEELLLTSEARPIVLLRKKKHGKRLCEGVCGTSPDIGAMLPCNPVQIMLAEALGPMIMTSANPSGELMATDNQQMIEWMKKEKHAFAILMHDRPILTPLDDSIVRMVGSKRQTIRRARGMVPNPLPFPGETAVFAAGGDLKACFCHTGNGRAYLGQHFGDLYEESCFEVYRNEIRRMRRLFGFVPEVIAQDMHPGYRSSQMVSMEAKNRKIQHHKAHVASVIAEHDIKGNVLGFAFDGTGYGDDGTIWGSEVFFWNEKEMERVAHLTPVQLIGGDEGAKNADTILYGYLSGIENPGVFAALQRQPFFEESKCAVVTKAISMGIHTVKSTSMGRLFDAVSAFLDICHYNSYEGQAPVELENLASTAEEAYPLRFTIEEDESASLCIDATCVFVEMAKAIEKKVPTPEIARGFLYALADAVVEIAERIGKKSPYAGDFSVALSGGTFLNRILLERVTGLLTEKGYRVYRNEQVPPGDGGLCLGQAYLASRDGF